MGKPKIAPYLLTALLVLGCLFPLPHIAVALQDTVIQRFPTFSPIEALPFSQNTSGDPNGIPLPGKLSLICHSLYPVSLEAMSRTREAAEAALKESLASYIRAGLLDSSWESAEITLSAYIAYGINNNSCTLWEAALTLTDAEANHNLHLYMDDITGALLSIDYQANTLCYPEETRQALAWELSRLYLSGLDPETAFEIQNSVQPSRFPGAAVLWCLLSDDRYGDIRLDFCVHGNGFYVNPQIDP